MKILIQNIAILALSFATPFSSDWTGEFLLNNGSKIIRTQDSIVIDSPTLSHEGSEISSSPVSAIEMKPNSQLHGLTLTDYLYLDMRLTENAFVRALIDSGVYSSTEEQMSDHQNSAQWTEKFDLNSCTISHSPEKVTFHIKSMGKSSSAKNYLLKGILFRTHTTRDEFAEGIKKLGDLGL